MEYLADTVAILRHLRSHPALGKRAAVILQGADRGEHHIYLSAITLMEVLYLSEAKRVDVSVDELIQLVSASGNYEIIPVDGVIVSEAIAIEDVPELHDRIIVASAKWLGVSILSSDEVMKKSECVQTIW